MAFPPLSIDDLESMFSAPDAKRRMRDFVEQNRGHKKKKRRAGKKNDDNSEQQDTPFALLDEEMIRFCALEATHDAVTSIALRTLLKAIFGEGLYWSRTNVALPEGRSRALSRAWDPFGHDLILSLHKWGIAIVILVPDETLHARPVVLDLFKDYQVWIRLNPETHEREYQILKRDEPPPDADDPPDTRRYFIFRTHPPDGDGTMHSILSCMKFQSAKRSQLYRFHSNAWEWLSKPGIVIGRDEIRDRMAENQAEANRIKKMEVIQNKLSGTEDEAAYEGVSGALTDRRFAPRGSGGGSRKKKGRILAPLGEHSSSAHQGLTQKNKDVLDLTRARNMRAGELDALMSRLFKDEAEPIDYDQFDPDDEERRIYRMRHGHTWKLTNDIKAPTHLDSSEQLYIYLVASNIGIPVESFHQIDVRYKQDRAAIKKELDSSACVWGAIFLDIARDLLNEIYGELHSLHDLAREEQKRRAEFEDKLISRKERKMRQEAMEDLKQQLQTDCMLSSWQVDRFSEIFQARTTDRKEEEEEEEEEDEQQHDPQLDHAKRYNQITKLLQGMTEDLKNRPEKSDNRKLEAIRKAAEELLEQEMKEFDALVRSAMYNQGSRFQGDESFLKIDPVSGAIVATLNRSNLEIDLGLIRRINQEKSDRKAEENHERTAKMVVACNKQEEYDILPGGVLRHKKFHISGEKLFNHKNLHLLHEFLDMAPKISRLSEAQLVHTIRQDFRCWARKSMLSPLTPVPTRRSLLRTIERQNKHRKKVGDLETTVRAFLNACGISPSFKDMCKTAQAVHNAFSKQKGQKKKQKQRKRKQKADDEEEEKEEAENDDAESGPDENDLTPSDEFQAFYQSFFQSPSSGSYDSAASS